MQGSHWGFIASLVRPHKRAFAGYGVLLGIATAIPIIGSLMIAEFVDRVVAGARFGEVAWLGFGFAGLGAVASVLDITVRWRATVLAWRITDGLRKELARHVLYADLAFHRDRTPGELLTRCDGDVTALTKFLASVVSQLVGIALLAVSSTIVLAFVEIRLAPVLAISYTVLAVVLWKMRDASKAAVVVERRTDAEMNSVIEQYLAGAEDVASLGAGAHAVGRFAGHASQLVDHVRERVRFEMRIQASIKSVAAMAIVAVLAVGAVGLQRSWFEIASVVLALRLVQIVRRPVEQLTWRLQESEGVAGAASRIIELVTERRAVRDGDAVIPDGPIDVAFDRTELVYDDATDGVAALDSLDLRIPAGRVVGLVGRTGSGKTTIARLLLRLVDPTDGQLHLAGTDITTLADEEFRRRVGAIPQDVQLFPGSVRDNVAMFGDVDDADVVAALDTAGLGEWYGRLPAGLDTRLTSGGHQASGGDESAGEHPDDVRNGAAPTPTAGLSAGQAQLLAIARALLQRPDLVVLDEATSRVDPETQASISAALGRLVEGRTAIVIAHRLDTLASCDDIIVLSHGEVVESGGRTALADDEDSHYARLLAVGESAPELA